MVSECMRMFEIKPGSGSFSFLYVGFFEVQFPYVTQGGLEFKITTLNLQDAEISGFFFFFFWLCFLEMASRSSGWPQTSCVTESGAEA